VVKVSDYKNPIPFSLKIANCFENERDGMQRR